ncbi:Rid family detoxifying hydrolase [Halalkalicoccus subterraneus]|uniref:Rid family detoxifying hydrolase n=1 Tax=Halalkalicoccus subterraneus TaxID=2675002 RepID=UPI000EFD3840|nr:Rid family detoxifying hydrolase [Halalkalicoccus subterraneus]
MKRIITTSDAPEAIGAYSQATTAGDLLFSAGQIALTPDGEMLANESVAVQTRQCLDNVTGILESEGLSTEHVVKTTIYLDDIADFDEMNEAYGEYFADDPPARSAFEVGALPKGAAVEIEAIATTE